MRIATLPVIAAGLLIGSAGMVLAQSGSTGADANVGVGARAGGTNAEVGASGRANADADRRGGSMSTGAGRNVKYEHPWWRHLRRRWS